MDECYCDYERPQFYYQEMRRAKKYHNCSECERTIAPGEQYENVYGKWDGAVDTFKTCVHCIALRDWVKAHVPCFCTFHGNVIDDAIETAREYSYEAPGLLFGAYRRQVAINRLKRKNNETIQ